MCQRVAPVRGLRGWSNGNSRVLRKEIHWTKVKLPSLDWHHGKVLNSGHMIDSKLILDKMSSCKTFSASLDQARTPCPPRTWFGYWLAAKRLVQPERRVPWLAGLVDPMTRPATPHQKIDLISTALLRSTLPNDQDHLEHSSLASLR